MGARAWLGLVVLTACNFNSSGVGEGGEQGSSTTGSDTTGSDVSSTSTGEQTSTSSMTTTGETTLGETTALDSTTSPPEDSSSGEPTCDASPPWWDPAWSRRRLVTVDASAVTEDLSAVPIRVRLDAGRIDYAAVQDDGADLRFIVEGTMTELPYEVEQWDESGDSEVWVQLPLVPTGGSPTVWMYYGNDAAAPGQDPPAVWDAGFVSVHHLADPSDATAQGHDGFGPNPPADAPGRIGRGRAFDGIDDVIELPQESDYDFDLELTVEAWIQVSSFTISWQAVVTKGDDAWRLHREDSTPYLGFGSDTPRSNDNLAGTIPVDDGSWHHAAIVYGSGTKSLYIDGQLDVSVAYPGPLRLTDAPVLLGNNSDAASRFFHGTMDEIRISSVERSATWIELQALSTADDGIVSVGDEQTCS